MGQNVNAWSQTNGVDIEKTFPQLIKEISELNISRIRYITSHPRDMTEELMKSHKEITKLQPYLHLPVQSGSDKILKEMNRNYTSQEYIDIIERTRKYRPDIAVSGDFIVGFPGETEADFEATLDIVKKVKYAHAYSFKYSPRPGTPAALKDDQIDEEVKSDRLKKLQELIRQQTRDFNSGFLEKKIDVLVEKKGLGENRLTGRSSYLQPVHMSGDASFIGEILKVKIIKTRDNSLEGVIL